MRALLQGSFPHRPQGGGGSFLQKHRASAILASLSDKRNRCFVLLLPANCVYYYVSLSHLIAAYSSKCGVACHIWPARNTLTARLLKSIRQFCRVLQQFWPCFDQRSRLLYATWHRRTFFLRVTPDFPIMDHQRLFLLSKDCDSLTLLELFTLCPTSNCVWIGLLR